MAWIPGLPLTSPAARASHLEHDTMTLWHEFLSGYFAGGTYALSGINEVFPACAVTFQQHVIPLEPGVIIAVVWSKPSKHRRWQTIVGNTMQQQCNWSFIVRAKGPQGAAGGPKTQVERVAGLLYGLLNCKSKTAALARKGIGALSVDNPVLVSGGDFITRSLNVKGRVTFSIG
jgi:hypothetical protein